MNYNMRKLGKRVLAMVLAIAMMFSLVPSSGLQVYATEETPVETPVETQIPVDNSGVTEPTGDVPADGGATVTP